MALMNVDYTDNKSVQSLLVSELNVSGIKVI